MANQYELIFLILPMLVALRLSQKISPKERFVCALICVAVCWWLLFASDAWYSARASEVFDRIPNPSPEMIQEFNTDGASQLATLVFGLPLSLAYLGLCVLVAQAVRWLWFKVRILLVNIGNP